MEIALNKESKRKTPSVVAFRDGMRTFGEDAQTLGLRFPSTSYGYLIDLLGKTIDNPIVELYKYVATQLLAISISTSTTCPNSLSPSIHHPDSASPTTRSRRIRNAKRWSLSTVTSASPSKSWWPNS